MWFLVSAIIFGSLFSIVFKVCQSLRIDTDQVIHFNYLTAFIIAVLSALLQSGGPDSVLQGFSPRWSNTIPALVEGVLFVLSFVVMDHSVWRSGVALTTVAARASLILPVIFSWIFLAQPAPQEPRNNRGKRHSSDCHGRTLRPRNFTAVCRI